MPASSTPNGDRLRVGSLFSGYGGLDLAVEKVFHADTVWFSEINPAPARVFAHHWPGVPNLGDISLIDWHTVAPVDIVAGGFPCQDVSTVGKRAGLAPGTRSGLWAHMATAIEVLQPQWVVAENVRGLLSATATRPSSEGAATHDNRNPDDATPARATLRDLEPGPWGLGDESTRPLLRAHGAVLGDLADLGYDTQWLGLPATSIGAPHHRFRIFILARRRTTDTAGIGLKPRWRDPGTSESAARDNRAQPSGHRPSAQQSCSNRHDGWSGAGRDHGDVRRWGRYAAAIARWERLTGRKAPDGTTRDEAGRIRPNPRFVEWLMGLDDGWVTGTDLELSGAEQLSALGNGVLPRQAMLAVNRLLVLARGDCGRHPHAG